MKQRRSFFSWQERFRFAAAALTVYTLFAINIAGLYLMWDASRDRLEVEKLPDPREYLAEKCKEPECDFELLDSIAFCESTWRMVKNASSSAYGYFQIIDATERGTPQYAEGKRKFDPYTNIDMGIYLYQRYGSSPWNESKPCWYWRHKQAEAQANLLSSQ